MAFLADENCYKVHMVRSSELLQPFVTGCHIYETLPDKIDICHDIIFPAWTTIRFIMPGGKVMISLDGEEYRDIPIMAMFGPLSLLVRAQGLPGRIIGCGVTPLGFARLFNFPANQCANRVLNLEEIWGARAHFLYSSLKDCETAEMVMAKFEEFFAPIISKLTEKEVKIAKMMNLLTGSHGIEIDRAAQIIGFSKHQFLRNSKKYFGFAPKILLRRSRFLKSILAVESNPTENPITLIDEGYFDYSHFVKDCHYFFQMSPSEFVKLDKPIAMLSMKVMQKLTGNQVQSLQQIKF